jgi:SAM-dependent methyltransferase
VSASAAPHVPGDVLVTMARPGEFLLSNVSVRTHALGDLAFLELLSSPGRIDPPAVRVRDASTSPFAEGLLGDPTGLDRSIDGLDDVAPMAIAEALSLARRLMLLVDDLDAYHEYLQGPRLNLLDHAHRGTIHQCVGEHVLLRRRPSGVDAWWLAQKFTHDLREPRAGLYRDVQWKFAVAYYAQAELDGKRILDFGCGPGLFARLFARHGAHVLGVDTNADHLQTARRLALSEGLGDACEFHTLELPPARGLTAFAAHRFDRIFLSDVLMFYFHPYDNSLEFDPVELIRALAALLAPGGRIEVLEPNGLFWQQPWLGEARRPYTVLTEYRRRRHGVTPTLEQLSRVAELAGLAITRVRELVPNTADRSRAFDFASEFPLWWFFELKPLTC